jgi:surface antigen
MMSMHRNVPKLAIASLLVLMLGACGSGYGPKQSGGTLLGAGLGGLLGSQFGSGSGKLVGVALGTLGGAMLGNSVGQSLDRADQAYAGQAAHRAQTAPIGQPVVWRNPDTGNEGSVVAVREGTNTFTGAYCREFQQTVNVGGQMQEAYGTACRQPDGSWAIQ